MNFFLKRLKFVIELGLTTLLFIIKINFAYAGCHYKQMIRFNDVLLSSSDCDRDELIILLGEAYDILIRIRKSNISLTIETYNTYLDKN
jgi:hypothetical protein